MNSIKVWYYFCILFLVYNLILLWEEKYSVHFKLISHTEELTDSSFKISICFSLNEIKADPAFNPYLKNLKENDARLMRVNVTQLLDYVYEFVTQVFKKKFRGYNYKNPLKSERYFLNNYACYLVDQNHLNSTNAFRKNKFLIFGYSNTIPFFSSYVYHKKTNNNFIQMLKIHRLRIENLNNEISKCNDEFKSGNVVDRYSKHECLNHCFKTSKPNLTYTLYLYRDGELLNLTNVYTKDKRDEKIESECFNQCKSESCLLDYYFTISYSTSKSEKFVNLVQSLMNSVYKSYAISSLEFYLQFFGLIGLFWNISIVFILINIVLLASKTFKLDRTARFKRYFLRFKFLIFILSFCLLLILSLLISTDFLSNRSIQTKIYDFTLELEAFSIILCMPVQFILFKNYSNYDFNVKNLTSTKDDEIIRTLNFKQIQNLTEKAKERLVKQVQLKYGSRHRPFEWTYNSEEILFRKIESTFFKGKMLARCFRFEVNVKEHRYQSLLTISILNFKLHHHFVIVYILREGSQFNMDTFNYQNKYKILKTHIKKENCENYSDQLNFYSQKDRINQCINKAYLQRFHHLPTHTVISKKSIEKLYENFTFQNYYFNSTIDQSIDEQCKMTYSKADCDYAYFTDSMKPHVNYLTKNDANCYDYEVNLFFIKTQEQEFNTSYVKLLFTLLNIESLFYGFNILKIFAFSLLIMQKRSRIRYLTFYKYAVNLFCASCFLVHFYFIFKDIIKNEDMVSSGTITKNDTIECADSIFCTKINEDLIDFNERQTGEQIAKLASNLKFENLFERIIYIKEGEAHDYRFTQFNNSNFRIVDFLFHNMRCAILRTNIKYKKEEFYFISSAEDAYPIKLFFNQSFNRSNDLFFLSKRKLSLQLNEMDKLKTENEVNENLKLKYQIRQELLEISRNDRFEYIKQPFSLFYSKKNDLMDATSYLEKIQYEFQTNYNLTSLLMLLTEKDFKYEIEDRLFKQFYLQVQNKSDHFYPRNMNTERQIYNNYIQLSKVINDANEADIEIFCSFFILKTNFINDDNYTKLFQQILTSLSLWLNVSLINVRMPKLSFISIYNLVKKLKFKLKRTIRQCLS